MSFDTNQSQTKRALLLGASGQDGRLMQTRLSEQGYKLLCTGSELPDLTAAGIVQCDVRDTRALLGLIEEFKPSEIYNFAALSSIGECEENPDLAWAVNADAVSDLLQALCGLDPAVRPKFLQCSSSEIFGNATVSPQNEETLPAPRNIYGETKLAAHLAVQRARREEGLFACNAILYNHESPFRGPQFVTRKISMAVARRAITGEGVLSVGNLEARRDWGHAEDFVRGMQLILGGEIPSDFILATSVTHSVRQFIEAAIEIVGMDIRWRGKGLSEVGVMDSNGERLVEIRQEFYRESEETELSGDISKARLQLGWEPRCTFRGLVSDMVRADQERLAPRRD